MEIFIGCSGYYYNHWKGLFYPHNLPKSKWLSYYADHFSTVEINNTFYRMPGEKAVKNWYSGTPVDFKFSIKGYRYFTHLKKLIIDDDFIRKFNGFIHMAGFLGEKAGPLLWQFPGNFRADLERLENFCRILGNEFTHVFEFRHESWFNEHMYGILEKYKCSLCIVSGPKNVPNVINAFSPVVYARFHGEGSWYNDNYSHESLESWKIKLDKLSAESVYAYFNNDMNAFAIGNAKFLASLFSLEKVKVR